MRAIGDRPYGGRGLRAIGDRPYGVVVYGPEA